MPPKVLKKWGWWILPGSRRLGHLVLILGRRADHRMIFHIFFSNLFYHGFFIGDCSKFCVKKNEIHCMDNCPPHLLGKWPLNRVCVWSHLQARSGTGTGLDCSDELTPRPPPPPIPLPSLVRRPNTDFENMRGFSQL